MKLFKLFLHHLGCYLENALVAIILLASVTLVLAMVFMTRLATPLVIVLSILLIIYWMAAAAGTIFNPLRYAWKDWKDYRKGKKNDKKK